MMNLRATTTEEPREPMGAATRFTYPGGSRPLSGYTIKRAVGQGGFGEVYYATSDGGKEVALKLIRRNLDVELRGVSHCLNLKHPNLVDLFDVRRDDRDDAWVIMEFVRGKSLEDSIAAHPQGMPTPDVLRWFLAVASGVAYLHDQGIVHRDLKPANIFDDQGAIKIGDYGLSKFISSSRRSGQTESVGTVHYMAPEIANGRYGKEIDIYALGVMLYEMLTGNVPFEGESVGEVLMKHLTAEPNVQGLPTAFRPVVARALTKDPEKRFSTVAEMLTAMAAGGLPVDRALTEMSARGEALPPSAPSGQAPDSSAVPPQRPGRMVSPPPAARPPSAQPTTPPLQQEPVWNVVRNATYGVVQAWKTTDLPTPLKVLILFASFGVLVLFAPMWFTLVTSLLVLYAVYFVIRAGVLGVRQGMARGQSPLGGWSPPPAPIPGQLVGSPPTVPVGSFAADKPIAGVAAAQQVASPSAQPQRAKRRWNATPGSALLPPRGVRERITELLGSLALGAVVATAVSLILVLLLGNRSQVEQCVWLALVGVTGTWALLIAGKFWEGRAGEPIVRRFVLLLIGLGIGLAAYGVDQALLVDLPITSRDFQSEHQPNSFEAAELFSAGQPNLKLYLAYFGFLFPVLRWWKMVDPARWTRFSILSTLLCVGWALVLWLAWPFPQAWGIMAACTIAVSVQLASPWVGEPNRRAARAQSA